MKPNIRTISKLCGCSPATVSNVLNHKKGYSKETEKKVLKAARDVGYLTASKMDGVRLVVYTKTGLVLSDTPFFSALISGIESECRSHQLSMTVTNVNQSNVDFDEVMTLILSDVSNGILLLATELAEEDIAPFAKSPVPVVLLDSWFDHCTMDTVLINNTDSVCNAVEYFVKMGHKKIGYLSSSVPINNFYYRKTGYYRALNRYNLPIEKNFQVSLTPTMEGAYRDMKAYLAQSPDLPSAYFADNDIIAFGAMKALKEAGYKIPQDISMIGFDDMPFCEITSPTLTTIRVFKKEMGQAAVRRLLAKADEKEPQPSYKMQICTELVIRDSVRNLNS